MMSDSGVQVAPVRTRTDADSDVRPTLRPPHFERTSDEWNELLAAIASGVNNPELLLGLSNLCPEHVAFIEEVKAAVIGGDRERVQCLYERWIGATDE